MDLNKPQRVFGCKGFFLRAFFIFARFFSLDHHQRRHQPLISLKQKGHTFALGGEGGAAIGGVHGAVQRLVGPQQHRRHGQGIIQIRQRAAGKLGAGGQNGLRLFCDGLLLRGGGVLFIDQYRPIQKIRK